MSSISYKKILKMIEVEIKNSDIDTADKERFQDLAKEIYVIETSSEGSNSHKMDRIKSLVTNHLRQ